ncbi:MAG: hypothetical protein ACK6D3_08355 [Planctomycetaceae bacterium]
MQFQTTKVQKAQTIPPPQVTRERRLREWADEKRIVREWSAMSLTVPFLGKVATVVEGQGGQLASVHGFSTTSGPTAILGFRSFATSRPIGWQVRRRGANHIILLAGRRTDF